MIWIFWFVIGLIAAIIYNKKLKKDKGSKDISDEAFLFLWGFMGLFFVFMMWLMKKYKIK